MKGMDIGSLIKKVKPGVSVQFDSDFVTLQRQDGEKLKINKKPLRSYTTDEEGKWTPADDDEIIGRFLK